MPYFQVGLPCMEQYRSIRMGWTHLQLLTTPIRSVLLNGVQGHIHRARIHSNTPMELYLMLLDPNKDIFLSQSQIIHELI